MNTELAEFATLFNLLWYRDFPLARNVRERGRRAEWTTHIALCVRATADLQGYFTHFEAGTRTDAVVKDASGRPVANIEWEWTQPRAPGFNELAKLYRSRNTAAFSALITYSRDEHHEENLLLLRKHWKKAKQPLLAFFVRFNISKGRQFGNLETYLVQGGEVKLVREQPALPWEKIGSRWAAAHENDG